MMDVYDWKPSARSIKVTVLPICRSHVCAMKVREAARVGRKKAIKQNSNAMKHEMFQCYKCRKFEPTDGPTFLKCARCRVAFYCSRECQAQGWGKHKAECKAKFRGKLSKEERTMNVASMYTMDVDETHKDEGEQKT